MKNVVSAYIERWNFVLGAIFVAIVIFMPEGLVPGSVRLWRWAWRCLRAARARRGRAARNGGAADDGARGQRPAKSFGGLRVTRDVNLSVEPGERRLIIGPNGAGKTTLFNLITGELRPDRGTDPLFDRDLTRVPSRRRAHLGIAAHLSDHHAVPGRDAAAQRHVVAARALAAALESVRAARPPAALIERAARRWPASGLRIWPNAR